MSDTEYSGVNDAQAAVEGTSEPFERQNRGIPAGMTLKWLWRVFQNHSSVRTGINRPESVLPVLKPFFGGYSTGEGF